MAFQMSEVTGILLADGWHDVAPGTMMAVIDPAFQDATGGMITPGGPWVTFADPGGVVYAFPVSPYIAVRYTPQP